MPRASPRLRLTTRRRALPRRRARLFGNYGAIGKVWEAASGQAVVSMPSGEAAWTKVARAQGLSDEEIRGLSMRSVVLAGHRLEVREKSVGILLVESTRPNKINQTHLDKMAESHLVAAIAELVGTYAMMMPAAETAVATKKEAAPAANWQSVPPRAQRGQTLKSSTQ